MDAIGASGCLFVGWKKEAKMKCLYKCCNFIICQVQQCKGRYWYLCFVYGEPETSKRHEVWTSLGEWLRKINEPTLLIGDFNQVEFSWDKMSQKHGRIDGAEVFNEWRRSVEQVEIPFKGPQFTWCNNREGGQRVYERLDKAYVTKDWLSLWPNTGVKHFPIQLSDHAPIEVDTCLLDHKVSRPYKFEAWCLKYEESKTIFEGGDLEDYKREHDNLKEFSRAASLFWKQRAKLKWTVDGDTCTKYFFNWVKGRSGRNFILGIKRGDGSWTYNLEEVATDFQGFYESLFSPICEKHEEVGESGIEGNGLEREGDGLARVWEELGNSLNEEDKEYLSEPITAKGVRKAVFQMGALKSPRLDGIPALFLQRYWFKVKK
ncbi:hypothetical protein RND81_03G038500 [Saponaria officinalis]|uniref:Endonuclease/exonuclease/phosphatase domain-containing protein n=1 Tax=Saponaria officinalis TaxID=3572 RepID=A0AAW1M357_SAPOF